MANIKKNKQNDFSIFFTQSKVVYTEWLTCAQFLKKNVRFGYVVQDIVLQICNIKPFLKTCPKGFGLKLAKLGLKTPLKK